MTSSRIRYFNDRSVPNPQNITIINKHLYKCDDCTLTYTKDVTKGNAYGSLTTPKRYGWDFLGWYLEDGTKIDSTSINNIKGEHTITAKWSRHYYQVKLVGVNGTITNAPIWYWTAGWENSYTKITPNSGYTTSGATVSCTGSAGASISGDYLYLSNITEDQTCTVTFKGITLLSKLLTDNPTISTRTTFNDVFTTTNTGTLYTSTESIAESTTSGYIGTSAFNSSYSDAMYVGYRYGPSGTLASNRTNENDSTIKTYIDNWYNTNLTSYTKYISTEAVYCKDRKAPSYNSSSSFDYYVYTRLNAGNPTYDCEDTKDAFSGSNSEAKLTYPIGLMTADEITYAGGKYAAKLISPYAWYYLNSAEGSITKGTWWWSLSPRVSTGNTTVLFHVSGSGAPGATGDAHRVKESGAVRPAISIKADALWSSGNGSSSSPYEIVYN